MAKPLKELYQTDEEILKLAFDGNTVADIAVLSGISHQELERRFGILLRVAKAKGNAYLRQHQMRQSAKDVGMSKFLGKNRLGQSENPEEKAEKHSEEDLALAKELIAVLNKPRHED
jgi:hypothetical protein